MPTIQFELKIRVETMLLFGAIFYGILAIVNGTYILNFHFSSQDSKAQLGHRSCMMGIHQFGIKPEVDQN